MKKIKQFLFSKPFIASAAILFLMGAFVTMAGTLSPAFAQQAADIDTNIAVKAGELGFKIPDLATILTFFIRLFFIVAGLAALAFGLWGAIDWVVSSGEQEKLDKARQKIIAALVGVILVVVVLAVIVTMEVFVFQQRICFGLSCPVTIPGILTACVPNPAYKNPSHKVTPNATEECCPPPATDGVRVITGWQQGTNNFGDYDYKICCPNGDANGDQICD